MTGPLSSWLLLRKIPNIFWKCSLMRPRNRLCMASMMTNWVGSKYGRQSSSDHLTLLEANAVSCSNLVSALLKALAEARHSSFVCLCHVWWWYHHSHGSDRCNDRWHKNENGWWVQTQMFFELPEDHRQGRQWCNELVYHLMAICSAKLHARILKV